MRARSGVSGVLVLLLFSALASAEGDWYTRVKERGLAKACEVEVRRHGKGRLPDSLHVGECYYRLGRWEEGVGVFRRLLHSPDENYRAMARARMGEGYWHLGEREKAKGAFTRCLKDHPEAWLDGSVADLCRAWLRKLAGELPEPEKAAQKGAKATVEDVRKEIEALKKRLKELTDLLLRLDGK